MLVARLVAETLLHSFNTKFSASLRLGHQLSSPPSNLFDVFELPDLMCLPLLHNRLLYSPDTDQEVVALARTFI